MQKVARASLAFSAFLWAHFFWKLSYCDSCPLPVRITSPGNGSSSRAHRSPGPTPSPLEPPMLLYRLFRRLLVQVCHFFPCKYRREIIFTTRFLFPSSSCFPPVFFLWFLQSFRIFSKLRDTFFSLSMYWSILVQEPVQPSPLRKADAWRHCCALNSCQNTQRSESRRLGKEERGARGADRGLKTLPPKTADFCPV